MADPTEEPEAAPLEPLHPTDPPRPTGAAPLPSTELPSTPVKEETAVKREEGDLPGAGASVPPCYTSAGDSDSECCLR